MKFAKPLLLTFAVAGLAACSPAEDKAPQETQSTTSAQTSETPVPGRWYSQEQVARGNTLFQANCATCHKADASGTPNWKETDANGKYPPPPLNGTAHTWHHPLFILHRTVAMGGQRLGGTMPGFGENLSSEQITDVLAWVQAQWPDEIYQAWEQRNAQAKKQ